MGRAVIKTSPGEDLYMIFSTIVDDITMIGTRAELSDEGISDMEFEKADQFGSSSAMRRGLWESGPLPVSRTETRNKNMWYQLKREDFSRYAHLMLEDREAEAEALMEGEPWEDE